MSYRRIGNVRDNIGLYIHNLVDLYCLLFLIEKLKMLNMILDLLTIKYSTCTVSNICRNVVLSMFGRAIMINHYF